MIPGRAVPQGSMRHVGGGRLLHSEKLQEWRGVAVPALQAAARQQGWTRCDQPMMLRWYAAFNRPKSHYYTGRNAGVLRDAYRFVRMAVTPDLDKVERAICDALTLSGVIADDRLIDWSTGSKIWTAEPGAEEYVFVRLRTYPDRTGV